MGMAYAYKKGELKSDEVSAEVKELADSMTLKQLKDFASTKHEGLPEVAENISTVAMAGMGPVVLPMGGNVGSGDVPAKAGDAEEEALLLQKKNNEKVRFQWVDDENDSDDYFFEFKIMVDEITQDVSLIITDFAEEDELEESKMLWDNLVLDLKQVLGAS